MKAAPLSTRQGNRLFDLVPEEIIESWIRGEYLLGASRNVGYEYIGWSLFARGFYQYEVTSVGGSEGQEDKFSQGYCIIDLRDGELSLWGIRTEAFHEQERQEYLETGFFQSEFSKLTLPPRRVHELPSRQAESTSVPIVYFGYRFYTVERERKQDRIQEEICERKRDACTHALEYFKQARDAWIAASNNVTEREKATQEGAGASPGTTIEIQALKKLEEQALADFELSVYEYLSDERLFHSDFAKIREAFDDFDHVTDNHERRNLYAIIQLYLKGEPNDHNILEADFDRIPDRKHRTSLEGKMTLKRRDVLELLQLRNDPSREEG